MHLGPIRGTTGGYSAPLKQHRENPGPPSSAVPPPGNLSTLWPAHVTLDTRPCDFLFV